MRRAKEKERARAAAPVLRWRFRFDDGTTADVPISAEFERAQDAQDRVTAAMSDDDPSLGKKARERIAQRFDAIIALRELEVRRSVDGGKKSLGLTWTKVERFWNSQYVQSRSAKRSDAETGTEHGCGAATIRTLRLAAGVKKQRAGARR